jgi:hypothetical protein
MNQPLITFLDLGQTYKNQLGNSNLNQGKFVQIRHETQGEFIIFACKELCIFHAQIVDLFCSIQSPAWAFDLNIKKDHGVLYEEKARIVGGGYFEIIEARSRVNLSGNSLAYGDYEAYGLEEKLRSVERFKNYRVFC